MSSTPQVPTASTLGPVRVRYASEVPEAEARAWLSAFRVEFGGALRPLPRAPDKAHVALLDSALGPLVVKRERVRGLKRTLVRRGLRGFRSEEAFEKGLAFAAAGFATAQPIACFGARAGVAACLITRYVDGLDPWRFVAESREPAAVRRRVVEALAQLVAELHAAGFRHRDLKAPNLLLREDAGKLVVHVIDLDGLERPRSVSNAVRIRDLARLCVSFDSDAARAAGVELADWKRCVELYAERAPDAPPVAELFARTRAWARAHVASLRSRRRPIA
jgi:tRNA A-37 threonylcarbamoyl transferase component Bud32